MSAPRNDRLGPDAPLTPAQEELLARYTSGRRAAPGTDFSLLDADGRLTGPPAAWMHSAELGLALEGLGGAIRYELSLPRRIQEIVILRVAAAQKSPYEAHAHTRAGRAAGLTDAEIEALLAGGGSFAPVDEDEEAVVEIVDALLDRGDLDDIEFQTAVDALGHRAVLELTTLVGYYYLMALQMRVFRILPPE